MASFSYSGTFELIDPCKGGFIISEDENFTNERSLGELTLDLFSQNNVEYKNVLKSFSSILNTPLGADSIVQMNNETIFAFGWCFSVDGKIPNEYSFDIYLDSSSKVRWFYAYSMSYKNKWISMCSPAHLLSKEYNPACK